MALPFRPGRETSQRRQLRLAEVLGLAALGMGEAQVDDWVGNSDANHFWDTGRAEGWAVGLIGHGAVSELWSLVAL